MKLKKTGILLCCLMVVLVSSCKKDDDDDNTTTNANEETVAIQEGDYPALLPFQASDARYKHSQLSNNLMDTFNINAGLMAMSKEHFPPDIYAYKEGQFLTYDDLDAFDNSPGLLGRANTETNPVGLNPELDTEFKVNDGETKKITSTDVLLYDIFELDWYKGKELEGISLAIVLNDRIGNPDRPDIIDESALLTYGDDVGVKVVNFLRSKHPEIGNNLPIYVTLYKVNNENDVLPGAFIRDAYFKTKTSAKFENVGESWQIFPSEAATKADPAIADTFNSYINEIRRFFPEDTSVIGKGHYRDNALSRLNIDIVMHAKSGAEVNAAVQQINSKLSLFTSTTYEIRVMIKCDTEDIAVIARDKGDSKTQVISLLE